MSRTTKPAPAAGVAAAAAPEAPPVASVIPAEIPIFAAMVALISAVTALAGFPSTPVPASLVENVTKARQAFLDVVNAPIEIPGFAAGATVDPYDDSWIKDAFEELQTSLKDRFAGLDTAIAALTERFEGQTPPEAVDLQPIEDRLAAIETQIADLKAPAASAEA